jgi:hypothetical protein
MEDRLNGHFSMMAISDEQRQKATRGVTRTREKPASFDANRPAGVEEVAPEMERVIATTVVV